MFELVTGPLLSLDVAAWPFKWTNSKSGETFMQGLGCFVVVLWCQVFWEPMWSVGWVLKMGAITRQIRRECRKNGSVKGSEEDVEGFRVGVSAKGRLEWCWSDTG
jgi:hypothetical protein